MNKRIIFIFISLIIIIIAVVSGLNYKNSFQKVTISTKRSGLSAVIKTKTGAATNHTISGNQTFKLKKGSYQAIPQGSGFDTTPISFSVGDQPVSLSIDPGFSKSYLSQQLTSEAAAINTVIQSNYAAALRNFTLNPGQLYAYGDWYGTTMVENAEPGNDGDVYRLVLHKENDTWVVAAKPALVLSAKQYPNIPKNILQNLNSQSGY